MGPRRGEGGVVPAARQPGGVVNDAQPAERLDQGQRRAVEEAELLVAGEESLAQVDGVGVAPGQRQPEILHGRPHRHVVEVEDPQHAVAQQDVAQMEIAVEAMDLTRVKRRHGGIQLIGDRPRRVKVAVAEMLRQGVMSVEPGQVLADESVGGQPQAMLRRPARRDVVQPASSSSGARPPLRSDSE